MRTQSKRVVFLLFHLDPVVDEVGVKDVAAKQEGVVGFQRCDGSPNESGTLGTSASSSGGSS